jgi:hypothetical protein
LNLREAKQGARFVARLQMPPLTPEMGPFPLNDSLGMGIAAVVLDRSLDQGKHEDQVQFETFRKARSVFTNISQASAQGLTSSVGAYEKNKIWISDVATHSFWYSSFMTGIHKRVGDVRKQDKALTIEVVKSIQRILEGEWNQVKEDLFAFSARAKRTAEMGVWVISCFCVGVRGEENLLIEFSGTAASLILHVEAIPHFEFVITGRTKGNQAEGTSLSFHVFFRPTGRT